MEKMCVFVCVRDPVFLLLMHVLLEAFSNDWE